MTETTRSNTRKQQDRSVRDSATPSPTEPDSSASTQVLPVAVDAVPWARVQLTPISPSTKLDGVDHVTPFVVTLPPGEYNATFSSELSSRPYTRIINIREGQDNRVTIRMPGYDSDTVLSAIQPSFEAMNFDPTFPRTVLQIQRQGIKAFYSGNYQEALKDFGRMGDQGGTLSGLYEACSLAALALLDGDNGKAQLRLAQDRFRRLRPPQIGLAQFWTTFAADRKHISPQIITALEVNNPSR